MHANQNHPFPHALEKASIHNARRISEALAKPAQGFAWFENKKKAVKLVTGGRRA
jgi:hypothetical protein